MISNFPSALQPILQQGYLVRAFEQSLRARLGYRAIADRETIPNKIGEEVIKTRAGLLPVATTPIDPAANTNFDNGMTPGAYGVEQYRMTMHMHGATLDLNMVTSRTAISSLFVQNAIANAEQAARTMDVLARDALFSVYMGGNTRVTAANSDTTLAVDDIRGFQEHHVAEPGVSNGSKIVPVSPARPLTVLVGGDEAQVVAAVADVVNVSRTPGGISGVLTMSASVTAAEGDAVVAATAPTIIRAGAKATSKGLVAADRLTMALILDAKASMESNGVPKVDGFYHCHLDPVSSRQLFADNDFKQLFQGVGTESAEFRRGQIADPFLGVRFLPTTEAYVERRDGIVVRRPILVGKGAIIEGTFEGIAHADVAPVNSVIDVVDDVAMVTRAPLDRLGQIIAQSWYWMGGYAAPSDTTANPSVIATANNASYKRACVIEHAG